MSVEVDLSVLILALNEAENLQQILPQLNQALRSLHVRHELIVVDGGSEDETVATATAQGATVITQQISGYAAAFTEGFSQCRGEFILTLDADCSHPTNLIPTLWSKRKDADITIGSRYVDGGGSDAPRFRRCLSSILNTVYRKCLALRVKDISSGFRLYRSASIRDLKLEAADFDILPEIIVRAFSRGRHIEEVPFHYEPRRKGNSHARVIKLGWFYLSRLRALRRIRFSATSCDYDSRAFNSLNLIQRYWQRTRHSIIFRMLGSVSAGTVLDIGCGSSQIIQQLPHALAMDISPAKLRFLRTNKRRLLASTFQLPVASHSCDAIVHSQVIEHVPKSREIFSEIVRVLKPKGLLILGTPDYGRIWWPIIEFFYGILMPDAYADEHISHYTLSELTQLLEEYGFEVLHTEYILGGELIIKAIKST